MVPKVSLHTVVETPEFIRSAKGLLTEGLLTDTERAAIVDYLAANPMAGEKMPGTGGARKLRWSHGGKGKRGGARVITYFAGPALPVFLLAAFGKGQRIDLSQAEKNELRRELQGLAQDYERRA